MGKDHHISKQDWIDEIKRLSGEGSRPIGREAFIKATGWKDGWWQVFWDKWSDALTEAGYTPNKLNIAFETDFILECLSKLAERLKAFPTKIQIKREARENREFPSHTVFDRLGNRGELLRKLRAYCKSSSRYVDLLAILPDEMAPDTENLSVNETEDVFGYIYVFRYGTSNRYKVGRSKDVEQRNSQIDRQTPEPIVLVHSFKTDDPSGIEAYWHNRFKKAGKQNKSAGKHLRGEWFVLDHEDLRALKRRTKFM